MEQLKVKDILRKIKNIKAVMELTDEEIEEMPIYLGDDEELNGIHIGWYINFIDPKEKEDKYIAEMIDEKDKFILIS